LVVSGVNDTADRWWAVSMTPSINIATADQGGPIFMKLLFPVRGISIQKNHAYANYTTWNLQHSLNILLQT
jgi:hypothetical protein